VLVVTSLPPLPTPHDHLATPCHRLIVNFSFVLVDLLLLLLALLLLLIFFTLLPAVVEEEDEAEATIVASSVPPLRGLLLRGGIYLQKVTFPSSSAEDWEASAGRTVTQ
jgi:hypothetical protein